MKIVIDIPEEEYERMKEQSMFGRVDVWRKAIQNGTPLPKGHGRLIDADRCIRQAWNDFYKHEDEWEKKDSDYVGVNRFYDQNGFECCLKTIGNSPTVIDAYKAESEDKA